MTCCIQQCQLTRVSIKKSPMWRCTSVISIDAFIRIPNFILIIIRPFNWICRHWKQAKYRTEQKIHMMNLFVFDVFAWNVRMGKTKYVIHFWCHWMCEYYWKFSCQWIWSIIMKHWGKSHSSQLYLIPHFHCAK